LKLSSSVDEETIAEVPVRIDGKGKSLNQADFIMTLLSACSGRARTPDNLGALDVVLDADQRARLDAASAIELGFPHAFLARPMTQAIISGGIEIVGR
jgi:hypothetical protein